MGSLQQHLCIPLFQNVLLQRGQVLCPISWMSNSETYSAEAHRQLLPLHQQSATFEILHAALLPAASNAMNPKNARWPLEPSTGSRQGGIGQEWEVYAARKVIPKS